MWLAGGGVIRLWTVAPDFDGIGGNESVPAGGSPTAAFQPAVAGTGGVIAKATTSGPVTIPSVPHASTDIVAMSVHDPSDDSIIHLDTQVDPSTFGSGWAAGESPQLAYVTVSFVPVA